MEITLEELKLFSESAQLHITWALSVIAGSIATILGTSYISPREGFFRRAYLLFIPGWTALGISIYFGDLVTRGYIAAAFVPQHRYENIFSRMNSHYSDQLNLLLTGIGIFIVWLVIYLLWWVYYWQADQAKKRAKEAENESEKESEKDSKNEARKKAEIESEKQAVREMKE